MRLTKICFVGGIVCGRIASSFGLAALTPHQSAQKSTGVMATSALPSSSSFNEIHRWAAFSIFAASLFIAGPCQADEFGVERDAPTLYTGETVEVSNCNFSRSNGLSVTSQIQSVFCVVTFVRSVQNVVLWEHVSRLSRERIPTTMMCPESTFVIHPI
jgi:hypothetical protein